MYIFLGEFALFAGGVGPTSDVGWGCMLRCGQMMMARALSMCYLGRGTFVLTIHMVFVYCIGGVVDVKNNLFLVRLEMEAKYERSEILGHFATLSRQKKFLLFNSSNRYALVIEHFVSNGCYSRSVQCCQQAWFVCVS